MSNITTLKKVSFPVLNGNETYRLYNNLKNWFDNNGYIYNVDYKLEWENPGNYVPDFIYCDEELAIMLRLRYGV